jgi:hypothetical protein
VPGGTSGAILAQKGNKVELKSIIAVGGVALVIATPAAAKTPDIGAICNAVLTSAESYPYRDTRLEGAGMQFVLDRANGPNDTFGCFFDERHVSLTIYIGAEKISLRYEPEEGTVVQVGGKAIKDAPKIFAHLADEVWTRLQETHAGTGGPLVTGKMHDTGVLGRQRPHFAITM